MRHAPSERLREAVGEERLRTYPMLIVVVALVAWLGWLGLSHQRIDPAGKAVGADFVAFHSAGTLVWDGRAPAVYDQEALEQAVLATAPVANPHLPVHYPPPALLGFAVPAALPYEAGLLLWTALSLGSVLTALWALGTGPLGGRWALAYPGVLLTVFNGQTSGFVLGLLGTAMGLLATRPAVAGAVLGGLVFKPNYLGLALLALAVGREWRALAAAIASAVGACALAWGVLGAATWSAWLAQADEVRGLLGSGALPVEKMPTVFAALLQLGVPAGPAQLVQAGVAVGATVAVCAVWWRGSDGSVRAGALAAGTLLVTPFAFDYDLALGWLAIAALASGARTRAELGLAAVSWALPLAVPLLAFVHLPLAPVVWMLVLAALVRR
ncbi:MAG: glycosyltransferase family 87 protein [Myxococcota bacterium]